MAMSIATMAPSTVASGPRSALATVAAAGTATRLISPAPAATISSVSSIGT